MSSGWEARQLKLNLYLLLRMLCVLRRYKQFYGVLGNWSVAVTKICKGELQADLTVWRKTYVFAIPRVTSDLPNMGAPGWEQERWGAQLIKDRIPVLVGAGFAGFPSHGGQVATETASSAAPVRNSIAFGKAVEPSGEGLPEAGSASSLWVSMWPANVNVAGPA